MLAILSPEWTHTWLYVLHDPNDIHFRYQTASASIACQDSDLTITYFQESF
jgi:hypothetical protein